MVTRTWLLISLCALTLGTALTVPVHGAPNILHTNHLTFSGPVGLPGVTLPGGSYVFERAVATSNDVVVVRSLDRTRVYYLGSTLPITRPSGLAADRRVTFGEPNRGGLAPITAWYPDGERLGHAFVYRSR